MTLHHITSHHITLHHIRSHDIKSHDFASHHITWQNQITLHHIRSHHFLLITSYFILCSLPRIPWKSTCKYVNINMCKTTWHGNNWKWKEVERNGWELKSKNRNQFSSKRLCNSYLGRSVTYLSIMMYCKFASWRVTFFHEKLLTHKSLCLSRVSFYIALCFFIT